MHFIINFCICVMMTKAEQLPRTEMLNDTNYFGPTRRILNGHDVRDTRPYMVYLRPATNADRKTVETNWLCGGAIIHERYILTSAACIEDVKQFYVVSGTHRWIPVTEKNDECINNGAKKAIWKCVPESYFFDGNDFDNLRWMVGDIAVVKVEDNFNFMKRVRGCDFIPKKIAYNNESMDLEKAGIIASVAGWGTVENFGDDIARSTTNSPVLKEADLELISTRNCKRRWDPRYHFIIENHMICSKDSTDEEAMRAACLDEVKCKDLVYSEEEVLDETRARRRVLDPAKLHVHGADHKDARRTKLVSGGFCENDHGGPLVHGRGYSATVIGVMSSCQTKALTHKCYGPFLFTSVYRYRHLINCALNKELGLGLTCRRLLKSTKTQLVETNFNWNDQSESSPKSKRAEEKSKQPNKVQLHITSERTSYSRRSTKGIK